MKLLFSILLIVAAIANAIPTLNNDTSLEPRQLLTADPSIACCASCTAAYDSTIFFHASDDFCSWAGDYMKLWTTQIYFTGDKYCFPGGSSCIQLSVQYLCGQPYGNEGLVTYTGCMGYLNYAINPNIGCGPSPYAGARIGSSNGCWIFQATADAPIPAHSDNQMLDCDDDHRWCSLAGTDAALPVPDREWSEPVQIG